MLGWFVRFFERLPHTLERAPEILEPESIFLCLCHAPRQFEVLENLRGRPGISFRCKGCGRLL